MPGGENFERAKLKWRGTAPKDLRDTPRIIQQCVDNFLKLYPSCNRLLSNEKELEKLGAPELYDIYKQFCRERDLGKNLGLLYLMLKNHKKLFTDTDSARFLANLMNIPSGSADVTKFDTYSTIVQEILSTVYDCMKIRGYTANDKLFDLQEDFRRFLCSLLDHLPKDRTKGIYECIFSARSIIFHCLNVADLGEKMGIE